MQTCVPRVYFGTYPVYELISVTSNIHLHTRADCWMFNSFLLKSKRNREDIFVESFLFSDDAFFVAISKLNLKLMVDNFSQAFFFVRCVYKCQKDSSSTSTRHFHGTKLFC